MSKVKVSQSVSDSVSDKVSDKVTYQADPKGPKGRNLEVGPRRGPVDF